MTERYLQEHGYPSRTIENVSSPAVYQFENIIFRSLSALTKPKVCWGLLTLFVVAYLLAIGPGHFLLRRRLDYRVSILAFLGCVAVFSVALGITGRRGYGESQAAQSLTTAHAPSAAAGSTSPNGSPPSPPPAAAIPSPILLRSDLYATNPSTGSGGGLIFNGGDGRILLDIPLYSARGFHPSRHHGRRRHSR